MKNMIHEVQKIHKIYFRRLIQVVSEKNNHKKKDQFCNSIIYMIMVIIRTNEIYL